MTTFIQLEAPDGETFYVAPSHIAAIVPGDVCEPEPSNGRRRGCMIYFGGTDCALECRDTAQVVADKVRFPTTHSGKR